MLFNFSYTDLLYILNTIISVALAVFIEKKLVAASFLN